MKGPLVHTVMSVVLNLVIWDSAMWDSFPWYGETSFAFALALAMWDSWLGR